jgi:hypothetical protein
VTCHRFEPLDPKHLPQNEYCNAIWTAAHPAAFSLALPYPSVRGIHQITLPALIFETNETNETKNMGLAEKITPWMALGNLGGRKIVKMY